MNINRGCCLETVSRRIMIVGNCMTSQFAKIYLPTQYFINFHIFFIFYCTEKNGGRGKRHMAWHYSLLLGPEKIFQYLPRLYDKQVWKQSLIWKGQVLPFSFDMRDICVTKTSNLTETNGCSISHTVAGIGLKALMMQEPHGYEAFAS